MQTGRIKVEKALLFRQPFRHGETSHLGGSRPQGQPRDWLISRNTTNKRTSMKEDVEGRWKKDEEKIPRRSHSSSSSFQADSSDSGSAEEMDQKHCKLGAKPKWSAHADWSAYADWSDDSFATPIPPWRNKSIWRITATKTVEGLMSEQPRSGVTQTLENQHEALLKKHAMEFSKLMKEFEEMKASGNGKNEECEEKRERMEEND